MSFAKDNWEEFEKLSLSILETYLPTDSEFSYSITHTPHRKDGGYDGLIIISSSDENIDQYKILSESKLRELSNKDLPMSDFSKTLIIAINLMAQEIYIFTNLHYSIETQKRIRKFSSFSNIRVELVDIFEVSDRVKELYKTLKNTYSPAFLGQLIDSVITHPVSKRIFSEKKVHISPLRKLIGTDRNKLLDLCYNAISEKNGIVIIKGSSGCGKTFFIEHLLNKMYRESSIPYHRINMEELSTVQVFLLKILSSIWNIDVLDIMNFSEQDINDITDYLSEEELSIRARASLLNILKPESVSNEIQQDIMQFYFFEYLKLCDFHSDLLQVCFKELHDLSLITVISPEQIRLYHLLQAKHYLAVGQYLALIKQTDELRIIDPKLRHIRAIGIKHQYGINNCILSLKRGIKRFPENTLLKYSYYDHLLSISINKGDFKAAKANIDILKTYKEILSLEDQIHLEFNELTVLFYSKEMKDTRQLLGLCGKAYQNNLHVELSRSYNLLGQFFWTKKDWKKAIDAFDAAADLQDRTGHQTYRWIAKTNLALINLELRNNPDAVMYAKEIILGYYSSKRDKFKRIFTADNKMMYTDFFTDKEIVSILLMLRILYKNDYTGYTQIIETVKQPDIAVLPKEFEHFISRSFVSMLKKTYYYVDGNFMIKC